MPITFSSSISSQLLQLNRHKKELCLFDCKVREFLLIFVYYQSATFASHYGIKNQITTILKIGPQWRENCGTNIYLNNFNLGLFISVRHRDCDLGWDWDRGNWVLWKCVEMFKTFQCSYSETDTNFHWVLYTTYRYQSRSRSRAA